MKKLRAAMQIHAQASIHGAEVLSKLEAGITVVTPQSELFSRYDVYFLTLF
ncbi:hypothetical protein [Comamonas thiooxydans]|uniref:hypothetical protein n=1 Tax=Comamonas thiooxydans TaxID=363952 RepID=UPI0013F3E04F|nr:hypothetical protein [Comamonas thiooxydans]